MKKLILSLVLLLTLSCTNNNDDESLETQNIATIFIGKGELYSNTIYNQENIVITNNNDWQILLSNFNSINNNITSTFSEANIDFNNYQIIVAIDKKNYTATVDITSVVENSSNITVTINRQSGLGAVISRPFHIVKIKKSTKPVVFQ